MWLGAVGGGAYTAAPMATDEHGSPTDAGLRARVHRIIFEADDELGKAFDISLLVAILCSIIVVMLESVTWVRNEFATELNIAEWVLTIGFTLEYVLRLWSVERPTLYARSFFGVVDLLAILPTYIGVLVPGTGSLVVIRALRLLRIFRVLKLGHFLQASKTLNLASRASLPKITVVLGAVMTIVVIAGSMMYLIEGSENGFTSIPRGVYWAIVTMTTVGYGDIAPSTVLGQTLAATLMILGYAVIAVPTGVVSVELAAANAEQEVTTKSCRACSGEGHDPDAKFCKFCGAGL